MGSVEIVGQSKSYEKTDNAVLLSICIPTYNRASVLNLCLQNIVSQKNFDYRTEVVILDNNSTDNTKDIVEQYIKTYPNIVYHKNDVNIGMEKNIIKVLKYGRGVLLKLWNDYCLFSSDKLAETLELVENNNKDKPVLFFFNKLGNTTSLLCEDLNCFFKQTTYWPTWIGTFSIWRSDYNNFDDKSNFEGLLFPHLLMLLKVLEKKKQVKIIYGQYFYDIKGIKKGGYDFFEIFVQNFVGKIISNLYERKNISFQTLYIIKSSFIDNFLKTWLLNIYFEKNHGFDSKNMKMVFRYFKFYPQLYFLLLRLFANPLYKAAYSLKQKHSQINA